MASFVFYDLVFLAVFIVAVVVFLTTRKKNLQRQGILYLYRTKLGINFIDRFAKKFGKVLKPAQYVVLFSGYCLMVSVMWMMIKTTYLYFKLPIASVIKAPPVAPLIPYFPKIFGLENFLPPLYFTYFIVALGIVAITHEFSHGIFARLHNFKIHSTGFAFLGPILGAFVEPDEKQMQKAKKFPQLVILAAGTFANVLMTILFGAILALFFTSLFVPAGVKFNTYAISAVNTPEVIVIGNSTIVGYLEISVNGTTYFVEPSALEQSVENELGQVFVYDDSPAFRSQMKGAITEIGGQDINDRDSLISALDSYRPGDNIVIKTAILDPGQGTVAETREYSIELSDKGGRAFLGIGFLPPNSEGVTGWLFNLIGNIKDPALHYESSWDGFGWFVYYLLWWIVVINFLVALFNMLPLGILDGGRYFYLTVWGLTGSESFGKKAYKFMAWFLLALFALLMIKWATAFF